MNPEVARMVAMFMNILHTYSIIEKKPRDYGIGIKLTLSEVQIITQIGDNPGVNLTQLADITCVTRGAISQMMVKLAGKKLVVRAVVVGFVLWSISYFAYKLWFVYPKKYADDWAYGYKQAYSWVYSQYASVDNIYITSKYGEPHIFALFYGQIDPKLYHSYDVKYSTDPLGWIHVHSFDKFHFTGFTGLETSEEIQARIPGKSLLLTSFAILPNDLKRDYELKAPNWKVMFEGTLIDGEVSN